MSFEWTSAVDTPSKTFLFAALLLLEFAVTIDTKELASANPRESSAAALARLALAPPN
jgi:hypothetical protein